MTYSLIGLESSSIMPLVAITPLTQECYETIWGELANSPLIAHEDSLNELRTIFRFRANTFFSNPIKRIEKLRDLVPTGRMSLKGMAIKLLLDGQMGGWIGNKNSRVQTFFFSDVIDSIDDAINDPREFSAKLIEGMERKLEIYNQLLSPTNGTLTIDIRRILPYWGFHNVTSNLLAEKKTIQITIKPDCESSAMFESLPSATRRDSYHYHMLKKEQVDLILVGDANYKQNICACDKCLQYHCEVRVLTNTKRNKLLQLA